jgi:hypothetical protein
MAATSYSLRAGQLLTVTAGSFSAHVRDANDHTTGATVSAGNSVIFGPYLVGRLFSVVGEATVSVADWSESLAALLIANAGVPEAAVQASLTVNPTGTDNSATYTAKAYGASGNAITIAYVDPGANSQALSVSVADQNITVSLATNGSGTITSTSALVVAAINASGPAAALVTAAVDGTDGGAGTGAAAVTAMARAALANGAGTGIGRSKPGGLCIDTENGDVYRNSGTLAAPAWTQLADVA